MVWFLGLFVFWWGVFVGLFFIFVWGWVGCVVELGLICFYSVVKYVGSRSVLMYVGYLGGVVWGVFVGGWIMFWIYLLFRFGWCLWLCCLMLIVNDLLFVEVCFVVVLLVRVLCWYGWFWDGWWIGIVWLFLYWWCGGVGCWCVLVMWYS